MQDNNGNVPLDIAHMGKAKSSLEYVRLRQVLAEQRMAAGISQTALAATLRKPQSYVSKVESGERGLDVVEFVDYAKAIGADPTRLIKLAFRER